MAVDNQVVSVEVGFDQKSEYRPTKVVFEMDDRRDAEQLDNGAVRIRHYPGQPPGTYSPVGEYIQGNGEEYGYRYVVTEGTVYFTNETRERNVSGSLVFTGGTEADIPYPVLRDMNYYTDGQVYSDQGIPISSGAFRVVFDIHRNKFVASRPIYGTVRYEYVTSYRIMRYLPTNYFGDAVFYEVDEVNYGQLFAFPRNLPSGDTPGVIHFSIHPPTGLNTRIELLRVVSSALVTTDGVWEKPNGWPNNKTIEMDAGKTQTLSDDTYIEVERVHMVVYIQLGDPNKDGYSTVSRQSLSNDSALYRNANDSSLALNVGKQVLYLNNHIKDTNRKGRVVLLNERYDVPWGKPFDAEGGPEKDTWLLVYEVTSSDNKKRITSQIEKKPAYHRKLSIKMTMKQPKPAINSDGSVAVIDEYQSRINAILESIWKGIDWVSLRAGIDSTYDKDLYTLEFDSSFPTQ